MSFDKDLQAFLDQNRESPFPLALCLSLLRYYYRERDGIEDSNGGRDVFPWWHGCKRKLDLFISSLGPSAVASLSKEKWFAHFVSRKSLSKSEFYQNTRQSVVVPKVLQLQEEEGRTIHSFNKSAVWKRQQQYYKDQGRNAWLKNKVPHQISTNY